MIAVYVIVIFMATSTVNASEQLFSNDSLQIETVYPDTLKETAEIGETADQGSFDYVQRDVDHKRLVWHGIAMMVFVALIISSAQSWNPR